MIQTLRPHWPMFRAGLLMHLSLGVTTLALAVVAGPALAWMWGQGAISTALAVLAAAGRAAVGYANARGLWRASAPPALVFSTVVWAAMAGYAAVFLPLAALGSIGGTGLTATGLPAGFALIVDFSLMVMATLSGAMIAAGSRRRRRAKRFDATKLPVVRDVADSLAEHRKQARLNI